MKRIDSRLIVEIPEILHKEVRVSAAEKNITIKNWVITAFIKQLEEEKNNSDETEK